MGKSTGSVVSDSESEEGSKRDCSVTTGSLSGGDSMNGSDGEHKADDADGTEISKKRKKKRRKIKSSTQEAQHDGKVSVLNRDSIQSSVVSDGGEDVEGSKS